MLNNLGRVVCRLCRSNMRLSTICPCIDQPDKSQIRFTCDGCNGSVVFIAINTRQINYAEAA